MHATLERNSHTNARSTSVGENNATEFLEGLELAIASNGGTDLLRTGSDAESSLGLDAVIESIASDGSGTAHVLGRVSPSCI